MNDDRITVIIPSAETIARIFEGYTGVESRRKPNGYNAACPFCDMHSRNRRHLSISDGAKSVLLNCYHCGRSASELLEAVELRTADLYYEPPMRQHDYGQDSKANAERINRQPPQKVQAQPITQRANRGKRSEDRRHMYMDANGNKLALKTIYRYEDGSKDALWYAYKPELNRISSHPGLGGMEIPFYRMERLTQFKGSAIVFVEGEKDADCIWKISKGKVVGTCLPNGAADTKWRPQYNYCFEGKNILILRDNDEPGERYAVGVAHNLRNIASKIRIINPAELDAALIGRKGADVSDLVDAVGEDEAWSRIKHAVAVTPDYFDMEGMNNE